LNRIRVLAVAIILGILLIIPAVKADPSPPIILVEFQRIVQALPVGVDIRYPNVRNEDPVAIFAEVPRVSSLPSDDYPVTIAYVHSCTGKRYIAIPVADSQEPTGVKWYLLLDNRLVPLSQLNVPIAYIEIPAIVVPEFQSIFLVLLSVLAISTLISRRLPKKVK